MTQPSRAHRRRKTRPKSPARGKPRRAKTHDRLSRNLQTLAAVDAPMAERLCWPVSDAHIRQDAQRGPLYRVHRNFYPITCQPQCLPSSVLDDRTQVPVPPTGVQPCRPDARPPSAILLFGFGLGEAIQDALRAFPNCTVWAWERDPWLCRLALGRADLTEPLASRRLRLLLGADLQGARATYQAQVSGHIWYHPFLADIYRHERRLLHAKAETPVIVLKQGTLFVDDVANEMQARDYECYQLDTEGLSFEEQRHCLKTLSPRAIIAINHCNGLAELAHSLGIALRTWQVDPSLFKVAPLRTPCPDAKVYTYRRSAVPAFADAGFSCVQYLPLASDPQRRRPLASPPALESEYRAKLSFVGASLVSEAIAFRQRILEQFDSFTNPSPPTGPPTIACQPPPAVKHGESRLEQVLADQRRDFSICRIQTLMQTHMGAYVDHCKAQPQMADPVTMVGEISASEKRLTYAANLGKLGLQTWGDQGWELVVQHGVRYRGRSALHGEELTRVYNASEINIDIGRLHQMDIVTMRVFDVLACGGFLLSERSDALTDLFEPGVHLDCYSTIDELIDKVKFYLNHPGQRDAIAAQGRRRVLERHTIAHRISHMLTPHTPGAE